MANARIPDNVHKLKGTYQKAYHGDPDQKPEWDESAPDMPEEVASDERARLEWQRIMRVVPDGVVSVSDRAVLTQYCIMWSRFIEAPMEFNAAQHTQFRLIQQELGFTPVSRGKVIGKPKASDPDAFE